MKVDIAIFRYTSQDRLLSLHIKDKDSWFLRLRKKAISSELQWALVYYTSTDMQQITHLEHILEMNEEELFQISCTSSTVYDVYLLQSCMKTLLKYIDSDDISLSGINGYELQIEY